MRTEILTELQKEADEQYRKFSLNLLPKQTKLLGVRIPVLRKLAKRLIKEGRGETYLNIPLNLLQYQEELMLYGMVLGNIKLLPETKIELIKNFVSCIDSWAVCDIFCADLKEVKKNLKQFYTLFLPYARSKKEYQIRFFYVMALGYFITKDFLPQIFAEIKKQPYVGFYDKMAVAWFISVAYVKFPEETEAFLQNTNLDKFVFQKSISKINDSLRVNKAAKTRLKELAARRNKA